METPSLSSLPNDVLLDIVGHLDTARDVARLGQVSSRAHNLIQKHGWKQFIAVQFPSLRVPAGMSYAAAADRFTYLDRCWDKRGMQFTTFREKAKPQQPRQRRFRGQSVAFEAVVDAHHDAATAQEIVAWGAGENLHVRWTDSKDRVTWRTASGSDFGYAPGTGDVTALKVVERRGRSEIVVGRGDGEVHILGGAGHPSSFASAMQRTMAPNELLGNSSPGNAAVTCVEWIPESPLLATGRGRTLSLYNMADEDADDMVPVAWTDVASDKHPAERRLLRDVKFLGRGDTLAVALGGSSQPVLWGQVTPTGVELQPAAYNVDVFGAADADITANTPLGGAWAIERVGQGGNLVLSSWQDGTFRLMDARTPSPHDALYRDGFQPFQSGGPLLVYGTERFVAADNYAPTLRLFDLRWSKPYQHSRALPCAGTMPAPPVKGIHGTENGVSTNNCCDLRCSTVCMWHDEMTRDAWRSDATVWIGDRKAGRVASLAKASDASDKFYCGMRGAVVQTQLVLSEDREDRRKQRRGGHVDKLSDKMNGLSLQPRPRGWATPPMPMVTLAETGIGLSNGEEWASSSNRHHALPQVLFQVHGRAEGYREVGDVATRRLDSALRQKK